ncbi:hypothetical protein [Streptomyces sp. ISL-100]|uniref:hypothetical protein n=1 Tax=Streptomyces sp. ISL-100 TaxID=2819173 RepID=UPI001BE6F2B7|nr:hypothetical protein [Streptomyces sp. ISL-100]MBT2395413.1 hypothetical protein [Streptomyces sp. ISL-100]
MVVWSGDRLSFEALQRRASSGGRTVAQPAEALPAHCIASGEVRVAILRRISTPPCATFELGQLVEKQRADIYHLNPMLAVYLYPEDAVAAVNGVSREQRLNSPGLIEPYKTAVAVYQYELAERRRFKADAKRRQVFKAVS